MDHLPNVFKNFDNLYKISASQIQSRLPFTLPPVVIENYVANRLLFPFTIPQTKQELQLDLAILSAVAALNSGFFYNQAQRKITIPGEFTEVYQNIDELVQTIISSIFLGDQATIIIPNLTGHNTTGTAIALPSQNKPLQVIYNNKSYQVPVGSHLHLPPASNTISINSTDYQITPGELGIYLNSLKI